MEEFLESALGMLAAHEADKAVRIDSASSTLLSASQLALQLCHCCCYCCSTKIALAASFDSAACYNAAMPQPAAEVN